jgi:TonB family protein
MSVPSFVLGHAMANKSQLHKRFTKMNTKRKSSLSYYLMIVPLVALALLTKACAEQEVTPMSTPSEATAQEEAAGEKAPVLKEADVMPEFPGGQQELFGYMGSSIQYPEQAKKEGLTGKVFVRFTVADDGSVNDAEVLKSDNDIFNEEALRVISGMPKWTPGEKDGKAVSVSLVLPIMFALSE